MQKIVSQQSNIYEFQKQIKTSNSKKWIDRHSQTSQSKPNILNSLKLKKKDSVKTVNNPNVEIKQIQENGRDLMTASSKHKKLSKIVKSPQDSKQTTSKIICNFQPKSIKQLVSQNHQQKNHIGLQFETKLIDTEKKSNQELKNIIQTLQIEHFQQIKVLQSIIYQLIGNSIRQNKQTSNQNPNNGQKIEEITRLKNQIDILKKRYMQTMENNIKLIEKFNEMQKKFKNQVNELQFEIKKLNQNLCEIYQNKQKERSVVKSTKKYSKDFIEEKSQKQKINLGHIFTFKKFDLSQKIPKSKIIQTDPQHQISQIKSNLHYNPATHQQYYNQKVKRKIMKSQETSSSSSIRIKLKQKLSLENDTDEDIKKSVIDEHYTQSSQNLSELELQSIISKI